MKEELNNLWDVLFTLEEVMIQYYPKILDVIQKYHAKELYGEK